MAVLAESLHISPQIPMSNTVTIQAATATQQFTGPLAWINQTLCQGGDLQDSHFQEGDSQRDHQEAVKDFQEVEAHLKGDFHMWDLEEEETPEEDQTNWWEFNLKCSREYEQKLSTSLLNGSFMLALTSPIQLLQTITREACSSSPTSKEQGCWNGYLP